MAPKQKGWSWPGIGMGVILLILAFLIFGVPGWLTPYQVAIEIQMGLVIVIAVGALIILLYLMASGFSGLGLANSQYALGLPEGSIRALIALFMILIFLIGSIYLFRSVSGQPGGTLQNLTLAQVAAFGDRVVNIQPNATISGNYDVNLITNITDTGQKVALQLVTVLATLVAAVSSFYFGSAVATSAQRSADNTQTDTSLRIASIIPRGADASKGIIDAAILGNGFVDKTKVKLVHSGETDIEATDVQIVNPLTSITCKFNLTGKTKAKWDVIIQTPDGKTIGNSEAFDIT
jgi:hypothetical protein